MRIIGGKLKKRRISSVKGLCTRPTSDKLREAIFNIINFRVQDAVVLDLYAGTGAFGLEALSRGAEFAVFIDNNSKALNTIKNNIQTCDLFDTTKIISRDILKNLNNIKPKDLFFNLIFMDPPYNKNIINQTLINLHNSNSLQNNAYIIIEHSLNESIQTDISQFIFKDQRKYSKSVVSFFEYNNLQ